MSKTYLLIRTKEAPPLVNIQQYFTERGHKIETALSESDWLVMFSSCEQELDASLIAYALKEGKRLDIIGYKPSIHMLNGKKNITFYINYENFKHRNFFL